MTKLVNFGLALMLVVVVAGCEWESSGDEGSWNDSYSWINFSGLYRGVNGPIVGDFAFASSGAGGGVWATASARKTTASGLNQRRMMPPSGCRVGDGPGRHRAPPSAARTRGGARPRASWPAVGWPSQPATGPVPSKRSRCARASARGAASRPTFPERLRRSSCNGTHGQQQRDDERPALQNSHRSPRHGERCADLRGRDPTPGSRPPAGETGHRASGVSTEPGTSMLAPSLRRRNHRRASGPPQSRGCGRHPTWLLAATQRDPPASASTDNPIVRTACRR